MPAGGQSLGKADLWQELKLVTWARTMSATWLVALTSLLLRVQLNILGRHIFLQTHLLDPKQCASAHTLLLYRVHSAPSRRR